MRKLVIRWSPPARGPRPRSGLRLLAAAMLLVAGCASIEPGPPRDVAGTWNGQCVGCPVQSFRLVITQKGEQITGTLRATGRSGLGERDMALNGKVTGRSVKFETMGADGVAFQAKLQITEDGRLLSGTAQHRSGFPINFNRVESTSRPTR